MLQILISLFISINSWAATDHGCRAGTTMQALKSCIAEFNEKVKTAGESPEPCTTIETKKIDFPTLSEEFLVQGQHTCANFISDDPKKPEYGPWGKTILAYLDAEGDDSVYFSNDLAGMSDGVKACPNWKNMSKDQKKHFWVWVKASISRIESGCDPKARNGESTNGVAVGLVQLDEKLSSRTWRGKNCKVKNVTGADENIRCGMDILGELLLGKKGEYKGNGELWGRRSGSYWQHLRQKNGGGISDLIQLNPYCKVN